MKIGIIVPCMDRPKYLSDCLWSLSKCDLSKVESIMLIDDASTDQKTLSLISEFQFKDSHKLKLRNTVKQGICKNLLFGYEYFFNKGYTHVINFDSDAVIKQNAVNELISNYKKGTLLTGFHSTTKNANGNERHKIISETKKLFKKESVGGINFCIDKQAYEQYMKPVLEDCIINSGNFDHKVSLKAGGAFCLKSSVIQHIGFESSLNHVEQPDIADDFYYWDLPSVTLIGVDNDMERLNKAGLKCIEWIRFGECVALNPGLTSKEAYSEFCIKEMYKHVNTEHALIFQHDGFVHNWKAWDNDWLQYDYIGAPWHYLDGMAVGNGGFSLRSRRLMEIIATDESIQSKGIYHPEDDVICRTYRPYLEKTYDIKFAPIEVAEKFSFEGYLQPHKALTDQFGVHGMGRTEIIATEPLNKPKRHKYVPLQFRGLGDILFLVPLIRALIREGNEVIWPIDPEYIGIAKHFPDLDMRDTRTVHINYQETRMAHTQYGISLPYRYAMENMGRTMVDCMRSKYELYQHDWIMWRELTFKRFPDQEKKLTEMVGASGKYILVNRYFGEAKRGMFITPEINSDLPIVEMRTIEGFTLIDWCSIIENASEIHTANSSINYIIELMNLDIPVYLYKRNLWQEKGFEHTRYLWENKCWRFVE